MAKRILIIDDEPELVKAIEIRLKAAGYEVDGTYDSQAGIDKVKETKPDLILLDIIMPKMTGYEVCKVLKGDRDTKHIPIIILTASQQLDLEAKCRELGIKHFISKPFETEKLLSAIKEFSKENRACL